MVKRIVTTNQRDEWCGEWSNVSKEATKISRTKDDYKRIIKNFPDDLKVFFPPFLPDDLMAVAIFTGIKPKGFYPEIISVDETDKDITINWAERGEYNKPKTDKLSDKIGIETTRSFVFKVLRKTDKPISFNKISSPSITSKPKPKRPGIK